MRKFPHFVFRFSVLCLLLQAGITPIKTCASTDTITSIPLRHPQLGVTAHFHHGAQGGYDALDRIMPLLAESGLTWVRTQVIWPEVEKTKGVYQIPEHSMRWINAVHDAGLKIDLIFEGTNDLYANKYDPTAYAKAAAWVAKELGGKVQTMEILNEPYNFGFVQIYGGTWNALEKDGSVSVWAKKYVEFLNEAAKAIKAANPKMKVIGLGSASPVNFRQLEMGIASEVDGIVDHPYSYRSTPEIIPYPGTDEIKERDGILITDKQGTIASLIRNYRSTSEKNNGPKELWFNEWGWSTFQEAAPAGQFGGLYAGFTENAQAKYILRRFVEDLALGVDFSLVYDFKDYGTDPNEVLHNFGLIDFNLKPKPAYYAVQRMSRALIDFKPQKTFEVAVFAFDNRPDVHPIIWDKAKLAATGTIRTYQFSDTKGAPLLVVWSAERADGDLKPRLADIELSSKFTFKNIKAQDLMTGRKFDIPFVFEKDKVQIRKMSIPDAPVILSFEK
jgi:hypothetical protein